LQQARQFEHLIVRKAAGPKARIDEGDVGDAVEQKLRLRGERLAERAIRIGLDLHRAARIGVHGVDPWLDGARVIDLGFGCEERQLESNRLGARIQRQERREPRQQCHAKSRHPRLPLMPRLVRFRRRLRFR
jgi:hypothetical protein